MITALDQQRAPSRLRRRSRLLWLTAALLSCIWLASAFFEVEVALGRHGSVIFGYGRLFVSLPERLRESPPKDEAEAWEFARQRRGAWPAGTWSFETAWPLSQKRWHGPDNTKSGIPRLENGWIMPPNPSLAWAPYLSYSSNWPLRFSLPLWMVVAIPLGFAAYGSIRNRLRTRPGHCTKCRYDLHGLAAGSPCPECGQSASHAPPPKQRPR